MQITKQTYSSVISNLIRCLCAAACAAMLIIGITVYGVSLPYMLIMTAFIIVYVMLPGLLIVKKTGLECDHISSTLTLGLFAGWSLEVLVYFINDVVPTDLLMLAAGPVLSAIYVWQSVRTRSESGSRIRFRFSRLPVSLCIFITVVMLYCVLHVQFRYLAPELADFMTMNPDKAYHIGLVNSLSHDYPLISPWVSGIVINYHIFSEVLLSIPVRLFHVPAYFIMLSFGSVWTTFVFSLSSYAFFREMSGSKERAGAYCLILLLSNIYITRNATASLAFKFALINDNSSGYGIGAVFASVIMFKKWYGYFKEKDAKRWPALIMLTAFIMLTTGIKGPMGAVMIAAIWGTILLGIIMRKVSPKALGPLAVITGGFMLVYMTVLSGKGTTNSSGASLFALAKIVDIAYWKKPLVAAMKAAGIPEQLRLAVVLVVFVIFLLTVFFVPFCIGYVRELVLVLSGKKPFLPERVLVYAACLVGFILLMVLNYSGHSQVYFGLVTVFLAPAVAFWFIEDLEEKRDSSALAKHMLRITVSIMAISLVATTYSLSENIRRNAAECELAADPHRESNMYMNVSREEYEGLLWLNENTENDALIANDRYFSVAPDEYNVDDRWDNRFFLYEAYSNRFSYMSGSGYSISDYNYELRRDMINTSKKLYDPSNEERGDLARELGVDYVVVSKRFTDVGDLSNEDYEQCFDNEDMTIYRVAG